MKPFQTSCEREEYHFESRAKEKRSYKIVKNSKPRAKEGQSINSSKIPNLVRKRKGISLQTSCGKGKEHQSFESRAEKNSNCKIHQKVLNLARNKGKIPGIIVVENLE